MMIPGDARLVRHDTGPTGRIFVLKFSSSSQRNFYWLQAQSEEPENPGYWSERDKSWIRRIDTILRGEEGEDEEMGDAPIDSSEIEHEGEQPRREGEDGGRA
jgi:26S proteasome regulatory subunit N13